MNSALVILALVATASAQQWSSNLSVEQLGRQYLEDEAAKLSFDNDDQVIDNGRPSSIDNVVEEEGRATQDTQEFNLENNKNIPSQSRLTENTYETNKRVINNRNTRLERYNIKNYITNDHTNFRTRVHNPHTITEVVNHNYRQVKPYITTYINRNLNTEEDFQENPTEESTSRDVDYDVEKLPVEHDVVDNSANSRSTNFRRNTNIINRPINRPYATTRGTTSRRNPSARLGHLNRGSAVVGVNVGAFNTPFVDGVYGSSADGGVVLSGTNTNSGFGFNSGLGFNGVRSSGLVGSGFRRNAGRLFGNNLVNSFSTSRNVAAGSATIGGNRIWRS